MEFAGCSRPFARICKFNSTRKLSGPSRSHGLLDCFVLRGSNMNYKPFLVCLLAFSLPSPTPSSTCLCPSRRGTSFRLPRRLALFLLVTYSSEETRGRKKSKGRQRDLCSKWIWVVPDIGKWSWRFNLAAVDWLLMITVCWIVAAAGQIALGLFDVIGRHSGLYAHLSTSLEVERWWLFWGHGEF